MKLHWKSMKIKVILGLRYPAHSLSQNLANSVLESLQQLTVSVFSALKWPKLTGWSTGFFSSFSWLVVRRRSACLRTITSENLLQESFFCLGIQISRLRTCHWVNPLTTAKFNKVMWLPSKHNARISASFGRRHLNGNYIYSMTQNLLKTLTSCHYLTAWLFAREAELSCQKYTTPQQRVQLGQ